VTAFVPSDTACLASSPGSTRRTAVWTSREDSVAFLLKRASLPASPVTRSKMSLMKEFRMDMPFLETPTSATASLKRGLNERAEQRSCLTPSHVSTPLQISGCKAP